MIYFLNEAYKVSSSIYIRNTIIRNLTGVQQRIISYLYKEMRYINLRFTCLLTYLLTLGRAKRVFCYSSGI